MARTYTVGSPVHDTRTHQHTLYQDVPNNTSLFPASLLYFRSRGILFTFSFPISVTLMTALGDSITVLSHISGNLGISVTYKILVHSEILFLPYYNLFIIDLTKFHYSMLSVCRCLLPALTTHFSKYQLIIIVIITT